MQSNRFGPLSSVNVLLVHQSAALLQSPIAVTALPAMLHNSVCRARCADSGYDRRVITARRLHYSYEEYLGALEVSGVKLEYCEGEIYAMAGGTPAHADLAASIIRLLGNSLLGRCRVSSSDLKVRVEATDLTTFPDVAIICGERQFAAVDRNAVTNPTVLVEVTSTSTEDYDRGEKLAHYKQIRSLLAVVFVSHRRPQVTVIERDSSGWRQREHRAGEDVVLDAPPLSFAVDELYSGVELDRQ